MAGTRRSVRRMPRAPNRPRLRPPGDCRDRAGATAALTPGGHPVGWTRLFSKAADRTC